MLWYPIKQRDAPDALARRLRRLGVAKILRCELMPAPPPVANSGLADARPKLAGSGLILVNPPYRLEAELHAVLPGLARLLGPNAASRLDWLAQDE
jgi:23S rRNA (adenine2030-N6)-methyltransferase